MGCSESMNAKIKLRVHFNLPIFKSETFQQTATIRTTLRNFCKQAVYANICSEYRESQMTFKITCKEKVYTIRDCIPIYDLHLIEDDEIFIQATIIEPKNIELTLKILYTQPKEITLRVSKSARISELLDDSSSLRYLRGDIELDLNHKIEDYDIINKSKLFILVEKINSEEVQI